MYSPEFNHVDEREAREFVAAAAAGTLITVGADGTPDATFVPVLWEGDRVLAHLARAGEQWARVVDGSQALLVVQGPHRYITPSWYASKVEHGRVVPTWNYSVVQLRGRVQLHDDADWTLDMVTRLTRAHEAPRERPWAVDDAPAKWVEGRLRAIVGIEIQVESVQARAKWSQDKDAADRAGVLEGLAGEGDEESADRVRRGSL
ncbi:FMN-binding negative transcriptional regulator [Allobranchiibius sp. CTAmp26]|uniref:FMN-binding negative transcriptional regulator n=1 Tax=Allobranchiibius sp. CTAmp26 TaxID=2815214 RepID=UPI001AA1AEEE|nr:FMN-binding negative transcriptional regulator [Allobranchiibius sp. CTAmp26]MBO1755095.1 FMN-binding negative transcriptional regulator [Allobranchiibius sp. CTAmp26]